MNIFKEVLIL